MTDQLATYLQDHLADANLAIELLRAMSTQHQDEPIGSFLDSLLAEIVEDRDTLKGLAGEVGNGQSTLKELGTWLTEKVSGLKLGAGARGINVWPLLTRFRQTAHRRTFHLGKLPDEFVLPPWDYNAAPTTFQPVIRNAKETGERELVLMHGPALRKITGRLQRHVYDQCEGRYTDEGSHVASAVPTSPLPCSWIGDGLFYFKLFAACLRATKSSHADGSLSAGLAHLDWKGRNMFDMNPCRIDAKLTQSLDNAMANFDRLEKNHSVCPIQVTETLVAAQAAWIGHKMTCRFCCGQQSGRVH